TEPSPEPAVAPEPEASAPAIEAAAPAAEDAWSAGREDTSVMPAWQPDATQAMTPLAPATPPAGVDDTLIMGGAAGAGAGGAEAAAPPGGAELRIQGGPDLGHTFRVGEHALRIGRSPDNDFILRDPATSGHHARLERRGQQQFVVDLGSTNGTLVNGEPVQERELKHQDEIKIGQNVVSFNLL
ncbi:MAG: FHA domain-containing protein, partial [Chloroflexota bacterium]